MPCVTLQEESAEEEGVSLSADGQSLIKDGVQYSVGDQVYVHPETFDQLEQTALAEVPEYAAKGRFHKVCLLFVGKSLHTLHCRGLVSNYHTA